MAQSKNPTSREIEEVLNWCWEAIENGTSHFRGMSYEEGVKAAIEWMQGNEERPDKG